MLIQRRPRYGGLTKAHLVNALTVWWLTRLTPWQLAQVVACGRSEFVRRCAGYRAWGLRDEHLGQLWTALRQEATRRSKHPEWADRA